MRRGRFVIPVPFGVAEALEPFGRDVELDTVGHRTRGGVACATPRLDDPAARVGTNPVPQERHPLAGMAYPRLIRRDRELEIGLHEVRHRIPHL